MDVIVEPRGDRAEEVVLRENPDLVLLDIMLPGKDGMTLCRDLRARWEGPIVLLTSGQRYEPYSVAGDGR
jgi:two-component system response regulator RstA